MSEDNSDGQLEDEFEKDLDDLDEDEEDSSEEEQCRVYYLYVLAIIYFVVEIQSSARQSTHHYELIKWKMDLELAQHSSVDFHNPDFVKFA